MGVLSTTYYRDFSHGTIGSSDRIKPKGQIEMKLIYAIVNNDDSHAVSSNLTKAGFSATKLASTGGFLMAGNTTFLVCSEDSQVDEIIDIIKHCSRRRKQYVPASTMGGVDMQSTSFPLEVPVGGATIFVTDIERFEKV